MEILRYAAFTTDPAGGNPAGVVLDARGASDAEMLAVAADLGYSESAFLLPRDDGAFDVRYFSPRAEVPFCGHATIAAGVAYADRNQPGDLLVHTRSGPVAVHTSLATAAPTAATLVSVPPRTEALSPADLTDLLTILRWRLADLDPMLPPRIAFAGAWHPVLAARSAGRLDDLDYDFAALGTLMAGRDWTTVNLVHRQAPTVFAARNPFPPGGVYEDPATGAAAAALGAYLRDLGAVPLPATLTIHQGHAMGRPSLLTVDVPADAAAGIAVTGTAVQL